MNHTLKFLLASSFFGCLSLNSDAKTFKARTLEDVDRLSDKLKAEILSAGSVIKAEGKTYYVSNEGNDSNDGLSPETAFKTLSAVNRTAFEPGDLVLFRRGDLWRGQIRTRSGVSYSAYGKGEKPKIYGSPWNGVSDGYWEQTDAPNVYVFSRTTTNDIGTLVFDDGQKGCAYKVIRRTLPTLDNYHFETMEPFEDYYDLKRDLDLWHDSYKSGRIYLCSTEGNPSERFNSIEFLTKGHCFRVYGCNDVRIDNFCIKYTGSHGIGAQTIRNFEVTNCELGWIGGSIQFEGKMTPTGTNPTRYGNAVEIWGGCDHYVIDHCWVYQIYDAALTFQWRVMDTPTKMKDIRFTNNLVEDCVYSIEYFLTPSPDEAVENSSRIEDAVFRGNILRRAGMGWGYQRPDKQKCASIKAWKGNSPGKNASSNFVVENNIIDRGIPTLLDVNAADSNDLPIYRNNIYFQTRNVLLGTMLESPADVIWLD